MLEINSILPLIITYRYFILFPIAVLEGPIVSLICGLLIHMGILSFLPTYTILLLGDFIPDTLYYYLGRYGNKSARLQKYISKSEAFSKNLELIEKLWNKHPRKSIFLGKIAYGLSTPLLISAGLSKMPFVKFASYAFTVTTIEYGLFMLLGYYIGHSYELLSGYIGWVGYFVTTVIFIFVIVYFVIQKYAGNKLSEIKKTQ